MSSDWAGHALDDCFVGGRPAQANTHFTLKVTPSIRVTGRVTLIAKSPLPD